MLDSDENTAQAGLTWSGVHVEVLGWMFGGVVCHATSKVAELSCDIYYTIYSGCEYYHRILCISWKYPRSVDIICISWKYPRSVDNIHISCIYMIFVDNI